MKFDKDAKYMNSMAASAAPNKRGNKRTKTDKNERNAAEPVEDECVYGIDCLNMRMSGYDSDSDSK